MDYSIHHVWWIILNSNFYWFYPENKHECAISICFWSIIAFQHDRCPSSNSGCPAKRQVPHSIRAKGMAAFYLIRAFLILHNSHHWEDTVTLVRMYWWIQAESWGIWGNTILLPGGRRPLGRKSGISPYLLGQKLSSPICPYQSHRVSQWWPLCKIKIALIE